MRRKKVQLKALFWERYGCQILFEVRLPSTGTLGQSRYYPFMDLFLKSWPVQAVAGLLVIVVSILVQGATSRPLLHRLYLVSTPLKLNTFCASHSTLLTLNNLLFNNNEVTTTSIQQNFNSTTLHFNKFSSTISNSTPLTFNNLTFNNLTFHNLMFIMYFQSIGPLGRCFL